MLGRAVHSCPERERTEGLADGALSLEDRRAAQRHLEDCESCRALFRRRTSGRFPRFRNYTIVERIGEGGFGVVYKAIHHAKQRTEALKVLFGQTPVRATYFQNEVRLVARLQHPNIATLYEAHLSSLPLYYTMEFVEGQQLDEYLREQRATLTGRINILKQVIDAVGYAHDQGVIHRDIKPQNIIVDAHGHPRIVDFGIAKKLELSRSAEPGSEVGETGPESPEGFLGTFGYVAPEQQAGGPIDARADIYSLGALLYHCITGEPAKFANRVDRLTQLLQERQVARAGDLAAIIARCVDPLPERRYATCGALLEDLDRYLAGLPIRARQHPTLGYRLLRASALLLRTRPLLVRGFVVLLVIGLLTSTAWMCEARYFQAGPPGPRLDPVLVTVTPRTKAAIAEGRLGDVAGLSERDRKSWRLLYGRMMERLAQVRPRAVIWDYYFPDCRPEFDHAMLSGMQALRDAGVPVVVGVRDLDINSRPLACPEILAAAHSFGSLASVSPSARPREFIVPACVQRGFERPVPALALAGMAAARHPDAQLDIRVDPQVVTLRYRKAEDPRHELRWYQDTQRIRYVQGYAVDKDGVLHAGDLIIPIRVRGDGEAIRSLARIDLEDVLLADSGQLRQWFGDRVVLVGQTLPGMDQHDLERGRQVYGCEVNALALQALLYGTQGARFERRILVASVGLWAILGAAVATLVPQRQRPSLRTLAWLCPVGILGGWAVAAVGSHTLTDLGRVHLALAAASLLAAGVPIYLINAVRLRQIQLAPVPIWEPDGDTLATTLLATASDSEGLPAAPEESARKPA